MEGDSAARSPTWWGEYHKESGSMTYILENSLELAPGMLELCMN